MQGFNLKTLGNYFQEEDQKVEQEKSLMFTPDVWSQWKDQWNRSKTLVRVFENLTRTVYKKT